MSWEYIAGFVDGEGSIVKTKPTLYRVLIPQTHEGVLIAIKEFSRLGYIYKCATRKAHWKDNWVYAISRRNDVLSFLKKVSPYLIVKKELVERCIPIISDLSKKAKERERKLQKRVKVCKILREQGATYREIAHKLKIDFGYARRLFLYGQDGVWRA